MILTTAFGKGGTGKTTTAWALLTAGALKGYKCLAVDLDQSANLTYALGGNMTGKTIYDLLTNNSTIEDTMQHTKYCDLIPSGINVAMLEQRISNVAGRDFILKKALEPLKEKYDLIIIDTHPDLNIALINALTVSDTVIFPMNCDSFNMLGLYQMLETVKQVQTYCNESLTIGGILLTKYKDNQSLTRDMKESIKAQAEQVNTKVFDTFIHESVKVSQAQALQMSLYDYAKNSKPAQDYIQLLEEIERK